MQNIKIFLKLPRDISSTPLNPMLSWSTLTSGYTSEDRRGNFVLWSVRGVNCKTKKYIMSSIIIYHSIHLFIIPYYIRYVQQHNSLWLSRMYYYVEPMNVTSFTLPAGISELTTKNLLSINKSTGCIDREMWGPICVGWGLGLYIRHCVSFMNVPLMVGICIESNILCVWKTTQSLRD